MPLVLSGPVHGTDLLLDFSKILSPSSLQVLWKAPDMVVIVCSARSATGSRSFQLCIHYNVKYIPRPRFTEGASVVSDRLLSFRAAGPGDLEKLKLLGCYVDGCEIATSMELVPA